MVRYGYIWWYESCIHTLIICTVLISVNIWPWSHRDGGITGWGFDQQKHGKADRQEAPIGRFGWKIRDFNGFQTIQELGMWIKIRCEVIQRMLCWRYGPEDVRNPPATGGTFAISTDKAPIGIWSQDKYGLINRTLWICLRRTKENHGKPRNIVN